MKARRADIETFTHRFEDVTLLNVSTPPCDVWANIDIEFDAVYEDHGVGPFDVNMQWSIRETTVVGVDYIDDENALHAWNYDDPRTPFWLLTLAACQAFVERDAQQERIAATCSTD